MQETTKAKLTLKLDLNKKKQLQQLIDKNVIRTTTSKVTEPVSKKDTEVLKAEVKEVKNDVKEKLSEQKNIVKTEKNKKLAHINKRKPEPLKSTFKPANPNIQTYREYLKLLTEHYPKAFPPDTEPRVMLKIGIHHQIITELARLTNTENINKTKVRRFIKWYTFSKRYRLMHIEGAPRYDLEGNVSGQVTKEHVEVSKNNLKKLDKNPVTKS